GCVCSTSARRCWRERPLISRIYAAVRESVASRCFGLIGVVILATALYGCHDAPAISHPVNSSEDEYCRKCHTGRAGVPRVDHVDKDKCTSCHQVNAKGQYPNAVPHIGGESATCVLCHSDGEAGAAAVKHLNEQDCFLCHEASERGVWPPSAPHAVGSPQSANCLSCHGQIDHADRSPCSKCHQLSTSG
ncbi:MAG: hypothetical protein ACM3ZE_21415, partial [Myxococcales bacterium]